MRHMGNVVSRDRHDPENIDREDGANVTDLSKRFKVETYLTQHSDIFHKHPPMEGHFETILAPAGQREGSKRLPGDNRPQWRSA